MPTPELLAIVEVDPADRVTCQAVGCGHGVYRRIHVVRCEDNRVRVYGSDCFGRLFEELIPNARPRYGTGDGRRLSDKERALLAANTDSLISQFEAEEQVRKARLRRVDEERRMAHSVTTERAEAARRASAQRESLTAGELASVEARAKAIIRQKYGIDDPDAPGWRGLVIKYAKELLGKG